MIPAGCETDILRRLAELPFLDRLELAAVSGLVPGRGLRSYRKADRVGDG